MSHLSQRLPNIRGGTQGALQPDCHLKNMHIALEHLGWKLCAGSQTVEDTKIFKWPNKTHAGTIACGGAADSTLAALCS